LQRSWSSLTLGTTPLNATTFGVSGTFRGRELRVMRKITIVRRLAIAMRNSRSVVRTAAALSSPEFVVLRRPS
jgi:hypothetical protein